MNASSWSGSASASIGPAMQRVPSCADRGDARVLVVGRPVDVLGLLLDVALEDLLDRQAAERLAVGGAELDDVALAALEVGRERDRDRPDLPAGQAHVLARPIASRRSP